MPPTLLLIRHAEAIHNATQNWSLIDPELTPLGIQQCSDLQSHLRKSCPLASHIEAIIVSPMRRTLQTATLSLDWLIAPQPPPPNGQDTAKAQAPHGGIPLEISADWQENSDAGCDTGCGLAMIRREWPALDFSRVPANYVDKSDAADNPFAFTKTANLARGQRCLRALHGRQEKVIAVVSHSGFLRTAITRRRFANADFRVFTFGRGRDGGLELFEDPDTARRGGGMGRSEKGIYEIREWDFPEGEDDEDDEEE